MPRVSIRAELERSAREGRFVRVCREGLAAPPAHGWVVGLGRSWVALQPVRDRLDLDGFDVVRVRDVTGVGPSSRECSRLAAVRLRRQRPTAVLEPLDRTADMLLGCSRRWGPLVLTREREDATVCEVGVVPRASDRSFTLRPISPSGEWEPEETRPTGGLSLIQFGGSYETMLGRLARLSPRELRSASRPRGRSGAGRQGVGVRSTGESARDRGAPGGETCRDGPFGGAEDRCGTRD
jgi:hypothetical protein